MADGWDADPTTAAASPAFGQSAAWLVAASVDGTTNALEWAQGVVATNEESHVLGISKDTFAVTNFLVIGRPPQQEVETPLLSLDIDGGTGGGMDGGEWKHHGIPRWRQVHFRGSGNRWKFRAFI